MNNLNERQEKLLEMLRWFHEYCEKNGYTYYMCGGTMLGAVRHSGFIPWDDDIDLLMPRKDYDRIISNFKQKIDHYILESPYSENDDYFYTYSKLYDTNTTLIESTKKICVRGIYIDIFPLDGIGNSYNEAKKNFRKTSALIIAHLAKVSSVNKEKKWYSNLLIRLFNLIPNSIMNSHKIIKKIDKYASSFGYDNNSYCGCLVESYKTNTINRKDVYGKPTKYKFENIEAYGVEKYNEYLTNEYGDRKKLPPKETREKGHQYIEMDLNKSYIDI